MKNWVSIIFFIFPLVVISQKTATIGKLQLPLRGELVHSWIEQAEDDTTRSWCKQFLEITKDSIICTSLAYRGPSMKTPFLADIWSCKKTDMLLYDQAIVMYKDGVPGYVNMDVYVQIFTKDKLMKAQLDSYVDSYAKVISQKIDRIDMHFKDKYHAYQYLDRMYGEK